MRFGKRKGVQRWRCRDCGAVFTAATGTPFSSAKLSQAKLEAILSMIVRDCTVGDVADIAKVSTRTAYVWRMKAFTAAAERQKTVMLSGKVWIDEFAVPVNAGGRITKNGRMLRGMSRNQIVVAAAVDSSGRRIALVAGRGHITGAECVAVYGPHISKGSTVVHDGIYSHRRLIEFLGCRDEVWKTGDPGSKKGMQPINSFCAAMERCLVKHIGGLSEYVGLYVAWSAFKGCMAKAKIGERVAELEAWCFLSGTDFKVKDRY